MAAQAPSSAPASRHQLDLSKPEFAQRTLEATFERATLNDAERTVELSFASEAPVDRWYGREILDITPEACDLSRLNNRAAFLLNHDWDEQVGVVTKAWIDVGAKKARCQVKLSRSEDGEEIFQDIKDGIRSLVSVGYSVRKMVLQSVDGDVETHRVTDWMPFEVSLVSVPADPSVGIGRSQPKESTPSPAAPAPAAAPAITVTEKSIRTMSDKPTEMPANPAPANHQNDVAAERQRVKDLNAAAKTLAERHPEKAEAFRALAAKCSETGDSIDAFNRCVLNDILASKQDVAPVRQSADAGMIGLKPKDLKRYSLLRAIQAVVSNRPLDGLEGECNAEMARKLERQPKGFFMPEDIAADRRRHLRALTATGDPGNGGYTVGTEVLASELVEYLRNNSVVTSLGARVISGLQGDVTIPRQLTGATAYWVSETGSITQSNATFGQIVGKPRRIGTSVPYSKQFLAQTSLDAEAFIVKDSDDSIAVDLDRVALRGVGGVEPLGIANLATGDRSTSVSFGAAPTWAKYLEFFSNVAANNAIVGTPAYVASVAAAVKAMSVAKFTNGDTGIWDNDMVGTFRARWTTQLLTSATPVANMVIFGDFSQVLFLEWAGRDVVVDPYSGKKEGNVEITIQRLMDVVIRRGKAFAISSDSGAQ